MSTVMILLGGPGSGKGTQAVRLSMECGLPHVSTGDLFRQNIDAGTPLGAKAKGFMDAGELVPDEIVLDMLLDRVSVSDCADGYVLDGFPRTLPQAEALLARLGGDVEQVVLNLQVSDDTIVERASGRLLCKSCGRIHHRLFAPPQKEGVCDACGAKALYQRSDDAPDVVRQRLRVYQEQTAPLVQYYEQKGLLRQVDGEGSPDEVFASLLDMVRGSTNRVQG